MKKLLTTYSSAFSGSLYFFHPSPDRSFAKFALGRQQWDGTRDGRKRKVSLLREEADADGMGVGKEVSPICRCLIVKSDELKLNDSPLLRDG